ncbi:MAG: response regulator [Deltaproteobacteria bacterium]|nr:response regulator [Deltaproteobacteria bacterium]
MAAVAEIASTTTVVGVGASAGGIEALRLLFQQMPIDTAMAFVVVQHLLPSHASMLRDTIAAVTRLPVVEATDRMIVEPDHVYVITPNVELRLLRGALELSPRRDGVKRHLPIDLLFQSLATELGARAIGVVLSGTGSDGTEGLKAIKDKDGITMAQTPQSAQFPGMPESALASGAVDYELAPEAMAVELARLAKDPHFNGAMEPAVEPADDESYATILQMLHEASGTDFSGYRSTTLARRIARRMAICGVVELPSYADRLRHDPGECKLLAEDILVHVTAFFRDPEVFDAFKQHVFPAITASKKPGDVIKIWIPGCSTGEEVYSTAIALLEFLDDTSSDFNVQIFATDLSAPAIDRARAGQYSADSLRDLGAERLQRFFTASERGYRISRRVRDLCVFVVHDVTRDPPFAALDLISFRNVLIYLGPELQKRVLPMFHACLNSPGFLSLGRNEGVFGFRELFAPISGDRRIFSKTGESSRKTYTMSHSRPGIRVPSGAFGVPSQRPRPVADAVRQVDHILLDRYAPPGVIVNDKLEVVQFRGRTGRFLESPQGHPQTEVLKMARDGLLMELRPLLDEAIRTGAAARKEGIRIEQDAGEVTVTVEVLPLPKLLDASQKHYLVLFESAQEVVAVHPPLPLADLSGVEHQELARTRQELGGMRQFVQSLTEEYQRADDDLAAANEELVASNEELQSTNEELESAKEELQAANEELSTLNDELRSRNKELDQSASDLVNVQDSAGIPLVIVDASRKVRRYTPLAVDMFHILPSDIDRPISEIKPRITVGDLDQRISLVIQDGVAREWEVQDRDGHWQRLQIHPYRSADGHVDGAVISLVEIDQLKRAVAEAERASRAKDMFLATLSHELRTPLGAILLQAQLLQGSSDKKTLDVSAAIARAVKLQTTLIEDLLDVSRITADKLVLDVRPVELAELVREAAELQRPAADIKKVQLELTIPDGVGQVMGDSVRIQQVVFNLLSNAIKFTPSGGHVALVLNCAAGTAFIRVSDTGVGIDPVFLPRVFDTFTQADSSSARHHGGLGLGLSIVRRLVEMHGGTVRAESLGKDQGAKLTVSFPLLSDRPSALPPPASTERLSLRGIRVLVVDDDGVTRAGLAGVLRMHDAEVRAASTAAEGLQALIEFRPQALLSDLAMPGEDGLAFISKVRALPPEHGGSTPAAALSAMAAGKDSERALAAGFQTYLTKPIDVDTLVSAVTKLARTTVAA